VLVVQHEPEAPPAELGRALAAAGLAADVRQPRAGEALPDDAAGLAGLAVLGGAMSADEDAAYPHLGATRALIRDAAERGIPVLGLCLGAQLAALALGGEVRRGEAGWEIGWAALEPAGEDPVARALGSGRRLFQWHQDTFDPPPGSVPLLAGGAYGAQGFRLGSVWAVQAHPEVDGEVIAGWCAMDGAAAELAAAGVGVEELVAPAARHRAGSRALLDAWCALVHTGLPAAT
jgi:GMP synthase-like glutamine amidotransferase